MAARAALLVIVTCASIIGCAATPASPSVQRWAETPAALSRPEPDPACHGTVQGFLARNGLEIVTAKVSLDASGRVEIVDVLSPDLTPAAKVELQRAFASCAWAPRPAGGRAEVFTTSWLRERAGR